MIEPQTLRRRSRGVESNLFTLEDYEPSVLCAKRTPETLSRPNRIESPHSLKTLSHRSDAKICQDFEIGMGDLSELNIRCFVRHFCFG